MVTITNSKRKGTKKIVLDELTDGQLLALKNALREWGTSISVELADFIELAVSEYQQKQKK